MLGLLLALAACGSEPPPPPPTPQLVAELVGSEETRSDRDDYWTERYGAYFAPGELRAYWATPPERRFETFSLRLLEHRLREDLLEAYRWRLTQTQVDTFRAAPDYESARLLLEGWLAHPAEKR